MASTNTIYSQIIDISRMDNQGLEVAWQGTATGTIEDMDSKSGINLNELTINTAIAQPSGTTGGMAIDLNQLPFKYMLLQYTNASGSGTLQVYGELKDLNYWLVRFSAHLNGRLLVAVEVLDPVKLPLLV